MKKCLSVLGNLFHLVLICTLGMWVFWAVIHEHIVQGMSIKEICSVVGINEIFTFIGAIAFILFGIVGIYDFAYLNGLRFLVPPAFVKYKEINYIKQAERMMELYYKRDIQFIQEYEKERTSYLLQAMGIEERQFSNIQYEIVKARTMSDRNIYSLKCKAEKLLLRKEFIVNQTKFDACSVVYDKVDYFLNMYTALYDEKLCQSAAHIMSRYLSLVLKEKVCEIDYIIIPKGSNFLLGLEVGRILGKPVISILNEERIFKGVFWDGNYNVQKCNNIVVLHDVLVTGKRLYDSIEKLPVGTYNLFGIFSLFRYKSKEFQPIRDFEEHGIEAAKINCLVEIEEEKLKTIVEEHKEANAE